MFLRGSVLQLDAYFFILFYLCQIEISLGMLEKKIFGTSEYYQVYCLKLLAKYQQHCVMQKTSFSHSKLQVLTGCYVPKFKSDISQETEREASTTAKKTRNSRVMMRIYLRRHEIDVSCIVNLGCQFAGMTRIFNDSHILKPFYGSSTICHGSSGKEKQIWQYQ